MLQMKKQRTVCIFLSCFVLEILVNLGECSQYAGNKVEMKQIKIIIRLNHMKLLTFNWF